MHKPSLLDFRGKASYIDGIVRTAIRKITRREANAFFVLTANEDHTDLRELQLFPGFAGIPEFISGLERELRAGRVVLALCPMTGDILGRHRFAVRVARRFSSCPVLRGRVHRVVAERLGQPATFGEVASEARC